MQKVGLRFNAGVEYHGKIYASAVNINGLFQLNLETQELLYVKRFSEEKAKFAIHRVAFLYKNEAWFVPQNGKYIAIVNLDTLDIQYLEPPFRRVNEAAIARIGAVYYYGNIIGERYLYLIPTDIDALLLIDLENRQLYPYYDVPEEREYYLNGVYVDGCIYLLPYTGNHLTVVNLRTNERKRYLCKYDPQEYAEAVYCGDRLWICPHKSDCILSMNLDGSEIEAFPLKQFYDENFTYDQIVVRGNTLYFMPFQADKMLKFDIKEKRLTKIDLPRELLENGKNGFCRIFSEDKIILASYNKNAVLVFDEMRDEFQIIKIQMDKALLLKATENTEGLKCEDIIWEGAWEYYLGLEKAVQLLLGQDSNQEEVWRNKGKAIWEEIKRE